jgi:hypothetical protein
MPAARVEPGQSVVEALRKIRQECLPRQAGLFLGDDAQVRTDIVDLV